jgi:signal transduction histidine kinase/ABC-type branched-subunit amino acid transport system ATPase component
MSSNKGSRYILETRDLSVISNSRLILDGISLKVTKGDIHAVVGGKGSGKTTLAKVISGVIRHDRGSLWIGGKKIEGPSVRTATRLGVSTLHQTLGLVQNLSVLRNLFLNRELRKLLIFADRKRMQTIGLEAIKSLPIDIDLHESVLNYPSSIQQWIEVARLFCFHSSLIVIDEVAGRLDEKNLELFHYILSVLRNEGSTILYLTRDFTEISKFASTASIIEGGKLIESVNLSHIDKLKLMQLTYSSLTSRAQLEDYSWELIYSNHFNQAVIENLPVQIVVADSRDMIVSMNKLVVNSYSLDKSEFVKKRLEKLMRRLQEVDESIPESILSIPFYDDDNAFMGTVYLINRRSKTFRDLVSTGTGAVAVENTLSGFAHEVNNPLGTIQNYLQIAEGSESMEFVKKNIRIIDSELKRLRRIIRRIINGQLPSRLLGDASHDESVDNIMDHVLLILKPELEGKGITIERLCSPIEIRSSDSDVVVQIILNLVRNAVESMDQGGVLTVKTSVEEGEVGRVNVIEVRDTGTGVPDSLKNEIFRPFFTTKTGDEVRGLGLSLCRDLVSRLAGQIQVADNKDDGRGSIFTITFPVRRQSVAKT